MGTTKFAPIHRETGFDTYRDIKNAKYDPYT